MRAHHLLLWGVVLLSAFAPAAAQQAVHWQPSLESAQRLAAQTDRLVLAHFWADWCHACKRMEREVLNQPRVVAAVNASFVPVKINADYYPATCKQLGVSALPTDVILTPNGQVVERLRGASAASDYVSRLAGIAAKSKASSRPVYARVPSHSQNPGGGQAPTDHNASAAPGPSRTAGETYPAYRGGASLKGGTNAPSEGVGPQGSDSRLARAATPPPGTSPPEGGFGPREPAQPNRPQAGPRPATSMASPGLGASAAVSGRPDAPAPAGKAAPSRLRNPRGDEPLCLDGYCPVELCENNAWIIGDTQYGIRHRGRTYLFAGPEQARQFWGDPDRYAPVNSGYDVVLFLEEGEMVLGERRYGLFFNEQVYLFSNAATREQFEKDPRRYTKLLRQAMQAQARVPQQPR